MSSTSDTNIERGTFESGAVFSACEKYRYALWRRWDWQGHAGCVAFVGLNPSTATESTLDPTIRRCINFAKAWGYGGLIMLNAYAYRATDPRDMQAQADPNGPGNDEALSYYASHAGAAVAAWGVHCEPERAEQVCRILAGRVGVVHCLGLTQAGAPKHPLYLRRDSQRLIYWPQEHRGQA